MGCSRDLVLSASVYPCPREWFHLPQHFMHRAPDWGLSDPPQPGTAQPCDAQLLIEEPAIPVVESLIPPLDGRLYLRTMLPLDTLSI